MSQHNDLGKAGEALAQQHLIQEGYAILATNWRVGKLEADIIAYKEGLLVFVEVKTRSSVDHGAPEEFVDQAKCRAYVKLANRYVIQNHREEEVRFDIIAIQVSPTGYQLNHIPDAYTAVGLYL